MSAPFEQALALHRRGDLGAAQAQYEAVLRSSPEHAGALQMLGVLAGQRRDFDSAAQWLRRAVQLQPQNAAAHGNLGSALSALKRHEEALASFDRAIALNGEYAQAYSNRGTALSALHRHAEAVHSYDRAIALAPAFAEAYYNRGNALAELGRPEAALESYERALALKPEHADAHYNRGNALKALDRLAPALAAYERAIALRPEFTDAQVNRSMTLLLAGDYERGWPAHEQRRGRGLPADLLRAATVVGLPWSGATSLQGKTILLYSEQGLGDTLQFCRYAEPVAMLGARVILAVQPPLKTALAGLAGVTQLLTVGDVVPSCDYHCSLMSLPFALRTTVDTIPARHPYLTAEVEKSRQWQIRLGARTKPRIGVVWSGGFRPDQPESWPVNRRRNMPLAALAPLRALDMEFYSLQKGEAAEAELATLLAAGWNGPRIIDWTGQIQDFSDTAALIEQLDLVISVDTSTAHLAAAMGKPVWLLNRFDTCWRWFLERTDSPWYPTLRVYRQARPGDWEGVVERVRAALAVLAENTPPLAPSVDG